MESGVQTITPETAKTYLAMNENNFRRLDSRRVELYAKDMRAGRWELNGATIVFGDNGKLIDGQHRLAAIVKSGVQVQSFVVTGATDNTLTLDRGKPRNVAQFLKNELNLSNETAIAAQARIIIQHGAGGWSTGYDAHTTSRFQVTDQEIIQFVKNNQEKFKESGRIRCEYCNNSILGAIIFLGSPRRYSDCELAQWFVHSLNTGEGLNELQPVGHLRNVLFRLRAKSYGERISPHMQRALITTAWNMTVEEKPMRGWKPKFTGPHAIKCPNEVLVADDDATGKDLFE